MPRVNRDLQRRLAARRERERRRPTERRYNFTTTEPELVDADAADMDVLDAEADAATSAPTERASSSTQVTSSRGVTSTRTSARAAPRPFSDYKDEYAYVTRDLRRVAAVIGGLLVALLVLYFLLPLLAR